MAKSCVVVLLLSALALEAMGDEDTTDSITSDVFFSETVNTTTNQPRPVLWFLVTTNNTQGHLATRAAPLDGVQGNISDPSAVVLITATEMEIPGDNGTVNSSNSTSDIGNSRHRINEDTHNRLKRSVDSDASLFRRKRTSYKNLGGRGYSQTRQQHCNRCQPVNPCGGPCGGGGYPRGGGGYPRGGGGYPGGGSSSNSWSMSSAGSYASG